MQVNWNQIIAKSLIWLAAEIWLNLLGLDSLADYSEFLEHQHSTVEIVSPSSAIVSK